MILILFFFCVAVGCYFSAKPSTCMYTCVLLCNHSGECRSLALEMYL
jgi:hypothetical protein